MAEPVKPLNLNEAVEKQPEIKENKMKPVKVKLIGGFLVLVLLGAATGYGLSRLTGQQAGGAKKYASTEEGIEAGKIYGVDDPEAFTDSAEGEVASGGIDGEGSHHLIREGGESQFVYLTSSIVDLDQFVGKKVKIWGQTFEAQKAGWLMDVGRLEVLE